METKFITTGELNDFRYCIEWIEWRSGEILISKIIYTDNVDIYQTTPMNLNDRLGMIGFLLLIAKEAAEPDDWSQAAASVLAGVLPDPFLRPNAVPAIGDVGITFIGK